MSDRQLPDGFAPLQVREGFSEAIGPFFSRREDGGYEVGFWVEPQHCNAGGTCHGGCLAGFVDMQLAGMTWHGGPPGRIATVSLTIDYLAAVRLGQWVQGRAEVVRRTRNLAFAQMTATADGNPCLRANGIFKI